jgi:hypothetical protein
MPQKLKNVLAIKTRGEKIYCLTNFKVLPITTKGKFPSSNLTPQSTMMKS